MDDKKERILTVAEEFFAHFGIKKTTMDEIAKKVRIGKSTLYYYFNSKTHIFSEVIKKESLALRNELLIEVSNATTPQEKLSAYVLARIKYLRKLVNYYTALTAEYLEHYSFIEKARTDFTKFEIDTISEILFDGQKQGVFQIDDIDSTSEMIVIAMKGLEVPLIMQEETKNIEDTTLQMLSILFKGIESR
jgi:AcrR family transcriptional regulator